MAEQRAYNKKGWLALNSPQMPAVCNIVDVPTRWTRWKKKQETTLNWKRRISRTTFFYSPPPLPPSLPPHDSSISFQCDFGFVLSVNTSTWQTCKWAWIYSHFHPPPRATFEFSVGATWCHRISAWQWEPAKSERKNRPKNILEKRVFVRFSHRGRFVVQPVVVVFLLPAVASWLEFTVSQRLSQM